jgi:hypothetical protein
MRINQALFFAGFNFFRGPGSEKVFPKKIAHLESFPEKNRSPGKFSRKKSLTWKVFPKKIAHLESRFTKTAV